MAEQRLRKGGLTGIALGVVALLACELPVGLALLGFGTLAAGASALESVFWMETIGIASASLAQAKRQSVRGQIKDLRHMDRILGKLLACDCETLNECVEVALARGK